MCHHFPVTKRFDVLSAFEELDKRIRDINTARREEGSSTLAAAEIRLLGQLSLWVNEEVRATLALAATADVDALLVMDAVIKQEFRTILARRGLVYDDDSHLVWLAPGSHFARIFHSARLTVLALDPESALVSKAVKAPQKNRFLVREAIASGAFPTLVARIEECGGRLADFA